MEHLLTVTETYYVKGQGILVLPFFLLSVFSGQRFPESVELRFQDGTSKQVRAYFDIPREATQPPPDQYKVVCGLKGVAKGDVPIGTEVWAEKDNA